MATFTNVYLNNLVCTNLFSPKHRPWGGQRSVSLVISLQEHNGCNHKRHKSEGWGSSEMWHTMPCSHKSQNGGKKIKNKKALKFFMANLVSLFFYILYNFFYFIFIVQHGYLPTAYLFNGKLGHIICSRNRRDLCVSFLPHLRSWISPIQWRRVGIHGEVTPGVHRLYAFSVKEWNQ